MARESDTIVDTIDEGDGWRIEIHADYNHDRTVEEEIPADEGVHFQTWHRRYELGERISCPDDQESLESEIRVDYPEAVILPVYVYEHSGIRLFTGSFSCRWDSGQVGVIWRERPLDQRYDDATKAWVPCATPEEGLAATERMLKTIVASMDAIVSGSVYGYVIKDPEDDHAGSCWGFIETSRADRDYMIGEARAELESVREGRKAAERMERESFAL